MDTVANDTACNAQNVTHLLTPKSDPDLVVMPAALRESAAATYTATTVFYLRKCRQVGGGPRYIKRGRMVLYMVSDLDAWLAGEEVSA